MTPYKQHELSKIFPLMPEDELQSLADDIAVNGLHEAVWLFEGKVLDGWHRYQACLLAKVNPRTAEYRGKNPAEFVKSKNWHRRHMTASQRALAAVQLDEWAGAGKPSANVAPGATLPMKNRELAKESETSTRTIRQAKLVQSKGSAALKKKVKAGEVSVKKAAAVAKLPKREQVATLDEDHGDAGKVDPVAELEHAEKEIRKLTAQVESLSKTDQAKEALTWQQKFFELEGRLNQCMATKAEAEKAARYATGVLAKLRKMLNVERNGDIERAIMDLKR